MKFLYNTIPGRFLLKILLFKRTLAWLSRWLNSPYSQCLISLYIKKHHIDMSPYRGQEYRSFADFFARKQDGICLPVSPNILISPCDASLSFVSIEENKKFFVKDSWYSLHDLMPDCNISKCFENGLCMLFRLSPDDYHHFCYIDDCYHGKGHLIPGTLHSVQPIALEREPVFRLNKRMWSVMDTKNFGIVAQIEVGAVLAGGIVHERADTWVRRGEEMGHFEICGSTIILLFQKEVREKLILEENKKESMESSGECQVKMGDVIGYFKI